MEIDGMVSNCYRVCDREELQGLVIRVAVTGGPKKEFSEKVYMFFDFCRNMYTKMVWKRVFPADLIMGNDTSQSCPSGENAEGLENKGI